MSTIATSQHRHPLAPAEPFFRRAQVFATAGALGAASALAAACGPGGVGVGAGGAGTGAGVTDATSTGTSTSTGTTSTSTGTSTTSSTSTSSASSSGSSGTTCTGTLSGAVSSGFTCAMNTAWSGNQNVTGFAFTSTSVPTGVSFVAGGGSVSGKLADMAYPFASFVKWGWSVVGTDTSVWGGNDGKPNAATESFTITNFMVTINAGTGIVYDAHGTFDAEGPWINGTPDPGTMVTVHVDF